MSSTERVQKVMTNSVTLTGGLVLLPGTGMTADVTFNFPPTTGPTGAYIQAIGGGNTVWSFITSNVYPTPVNDIYHALTNQLININVISGTGTNTGGIDTSAGTAIQSVSILTAPKYGTLSATGSTGQYTYRSFPRYAGQDQFYYSIKDASGTTSLSSAICMISVDTGPTGGYTGATFLYSCTGTTNCILYDNGTESTFFTATFPGFGGSPTGIGSLCTNRDDNLIYYTSQGHTQGLLFAYDYANRSQFFIGNMTGGVNFSGLGGFMYNQSYLYYMKSSSSTTAFYGTIVLPYAPGTTQAILISQDGSIGTATQQTSITWDYQENNILFCGITGMLQICNPFVMAPSLRVVPSVSGIKRLSVAASYDGLHYAIDRGTTGVYNLDLYTGSLTGTFPPISRTDISSMAEWVNAYTNLP